jgi:3-oxoacyl-[acyl-carrier-protein] synthase-1
MICKIGDSIISSLGFTTEENYHAVKCGITGVKHYDAGTFGLPEPFMASLIDKERLIDEFHRNDGYTDLEKAAILSVYSANKEAQIDLASKKTIFILSTTKGNIEQLTMNNEPLSMKGQNHCSLFTSHSSLYLWHTAELISGFFKNPNAPIVVSNACISGAAAQITAMRKLHSENYDCAVVVGVDFLSKFIISGFQAFKALSPELCKPFDKNRCGLNLGEAAATIIYAHRHCGLDPQSPAVAEMTLLNGAIRNDATHISAPSRTGEGSFRALNNVLQNIDINDIAFINAHGTATPYNDDMEMNAIVRAGLVDVPVNSLKSYFGHTLGAAGVVETIISMRALSEGIVLKTLGFEESDPLTMNNEQLIMNNEQLTMNNEQLTMNNEQLKMNNEQSKMNNEQLKMNVCKENMVTNKRYFVKMMSGFGGVNAALLIRINS